jgi:3-oxoacyl-[acyl-carrier protein] reductase/meso-butanediol dehydrogenase/(S,S)-butanediol dehydrogenase/diacetyl reductase
MERRKMLKVKQKTVIITGGSKGIGFAIAKYFYKKGYFVLIAARNEPENIKEIGENVKFQKTDVRYLKDHQNLIRNAINHTGKIDVYINCAGFSKWRSIDKVDEDFWNEMIETNLKGTYWGCKAAAEKLQKGGCIINVSSLAGKRGSSNNSVYCSSKFGVNGLTQALAKELGPKGIRINAVCPVYIQTEGVLNSLEEKDSPSGGKNVQDYLKKFSLENAALKRLPTGEEVAKLCYFLASEEASGMTGQCINIDCGVLPQ